MKIEGVERKQSLPMIPNYIKRGVIIDLSALKSLY